MRNKLFLFICALASFSFAVCCPVCAEVLVYEQNGVFTKKHTLAAAATAADVVGKSVVITSPQLVTSAIAWPGDRELKFEKGGYITFSGSGSLTGLKEARPEWFGAKSDGSDASITQNNAALQASFNASKTVLLSAGTYKFSTNLTLQPDTTMRGVNEYATKLQFSGSGIALTCKGGYVQFYDFFLHGSPSSPLYFTEKSKGVYSDSMPGRPHFGQNLVMHNVRIQGFETLVEGNGYYWKFYNCSFLYSKYAFNNVSSNNLSYYGCRFAYAQDFIRSVGGNGPISLFGCSIESWSGAAITAVSGGKLLVNMSGCYVENYPDINLTGTGLAGNFKAANLIVGDMQSVNFTGNSIQCKGVRRVLYITNDSVVISTGNTFWYESGASTTEYLYFISNANAIFHAQDNAIPLKSLGIGTYTTSNFISTSNATGYNPITRKILKLRE